MEHDSMEVLIFIVCMIAIGISLLLIGMAIGRGMVMNDPYTFVQHKDDTMVNQLSAKTLAVRAWENYITQQPTTEMRKIEHENNRPSY